MTTSFPQAASWQKARFRAGMSLLELMLVLALLVIIGALALPAFRAPFANQKLRKSGELVRVEWAKARNRAMKTGQIQIFQYDADGSGYRVQPYLTEQDVLEANRQTSQQLGLDPTFGVNQQPVTTRMQPESVDEKQLPEGVIFAGGTVASDSRLMQFEQELTNMQTGGAQSTVPILFYPDGTSSDTRLILMNEEPFFVVVTLRGLTGIARVSDLMTHDEIAQLQ
jgi:prepilin-type N-terminal cleavage/methylation domain-containing protein